MKNLPKSLIDSAAKLHAKTDGDCYMCYDAESWAKFSSREMFEGLPWMKSNNIPPCLWSYGCLLKFDLEKQDEKLKDGKLKIFEEEIKFEIEKSGANEYTMDRVITQIEKGGCFLPRYLGEMDEKMAKFYLKTYGIDFTDMNIMLATQCFTLYLLSEHSMDSIPRLNKAEWARNQLTNYENQLDELVASFSNANGEKQVLKKIKKTKKVPQARSRPKISKIRPTRKAKKVEDDVSVKQNKYNKRFTKTKKPAKL